MSQAGSLGGGIIPPGSVVLTLQGDAGAPVGPDGSGNIDVLGGNGITTTGNPGLNTLTIDVDGSVATQYNTNSGSATPAFGILEILGGTNITTSGAGDTVTVSETQSVVLNNYSVANFTPYVVAATDYYITVDTSAIPITIQLPDAPTAYQVFIIKDSAGNAAAQNITVTTVGGLLNIDAATTFVMNTDWQSIHVVWDLFGYQVF